MLEFCLLIDARMILEWALHSVNLTIAKLLKIRVDLHLGPILEILQTTYTEAFILYVSKRSQLRYIKLYKKLVISFLRPGAQRRGHNYNGFNRGQREAAYLSLGLNQLMWRHLNISQQTHHVHLYNVLQCCVVVLS